MSRRIADIVARLREGGARTASFFRALTSDQWQTVVYEDEPWQVRDVLAHLVTIERSMQWLFRNMAEGGSGSPPDFDLDRFNRSQVAKLAGVTPETLIAQFEDVRAETVRLVESLAEADLDREGRHAFHGPGRLEQFIRWGYEHAAIHEQDMRRALEMDLHR